jgi:hypothetical protein
VREEDEFMPILLQSSEAENESIARELQVGLSINYPRPFPLNCGILSMIISLSGILSFIDPKTGREITRAVDLKSLQDKIFEIPG